MPLVLKQLSPDDRPWRIDWFGDMSYPGGTGRRSQPSVTVSISPVICDPADDVALLSPEATAHRQQRFRHVAIGMLPMLKVGDIWQQGQLIREPRYQKLSCRGLEIERVHGHKGLVNIIKAGLPFNESYLLPLDEHPWHRLQTQSYCVLVALPENRRLIIPCMELIRFYFGSSSGLLHKLFTGPLAPEKLWEHKHFDPDHKELYLKLAEGISGHSAEDIGRIANCPTAWKAAMQIYDSCLSASIQHLPVYPYTTFPFDGCTDLRASGKWLSHRGVPNSTFVVYSLQSCSHPFPFQELRYEVNDNMRVHKPGGNSDQAAQGSKSKRIRLKNYQNSTLSNSDPGKTKSLREMRISRNPKFPDLANKFIHRVKYETADKPEIMRINSVGEIERVSTGDGVGSNGTRQLEVTFDSLATQPTSKEKLPNFVIEGAKSAIDLVQADHGTAAWAPIILPGYTAPVISLPVLVDEDGVIDPIVLHSANGTERQRRACFIQIDNHAQHAVISAFIVEAAAPHLETQTNIVPTADIVIGMKRLFGHYSHAIPLSPT